MRAALELFARRWWNGELGGVGSALSVLAAPLSWAWSGANRIRDRRVERLDPIRIDGLHVVSVGNLAVGGTGKTPVAAWLAATLHAGGVPTCVLVGDYAGDEALLHRTWNPGVPVVVDRDRVAGARRARAQGVRVAVLDDGFQHRRLGRDLDLVLLSADDGFPGPLLPRGPYRESPRSLARADSVLITRRRATEQAARALAARVDRLVPGVVRGGVHLAAGPWMGIDGSPRRPAPGDVLAVCGVARPETFKAAVEGCVEGSVELAAFVDHHDYSRADVGRLRGRAGARPIVVTAKDAEKLRAHEEVLGEAFVLAEELRWDWGEETFAGLVEAFLVEVVGP